MAEKTSKSEEEYFAKLEYEKRKALAEKKAQEMASEERTRLKELHHMHCPKCGQELITVKLNAVEVDRCPGCDGLWLDAGELEQVLEQDGSGPLKRLIRIFRE